MGSCTSHSSDDTQQELEELDDQTIFSVTPPARGKKRCADFGGQCIATLTPAQLVSVHNYKDLRVLMLHNNYLFALPDELRSCTSLEELSLHGNRFTTVPEVVKLLPSLAHLNISNNPLSKTGCCDVLPLVPRLETLTMSMCSLRQVPPAVFQCKSLTSLDLSFNESIMLDPPRPSGVVNSSSGKSFHSLPALSQLSIGYCALRGALPGPIQQMKALTMLDISGNYFDLFDRNFFGELLLDRIEELRLHNLNLTTIPSSVTCLRKLLTIDLSKNPLLSVEGLYGGCFDSTDSAAISRASLTTLRLSSCNITAFPRGMHDLISLTNLDISQNNNFNDPNSQFDVFVNLEVLNVVGCLFSSNTDGRDTEWFEISKLKKLREIEWSFWVDKGRTSFNPYSTKFPLQLCGLPIQKLNGVQVKEGLFVGNAIDTLINILNDGYYKVDFLFESQALWHHMLTLKLLVPLEKGFFFVNSEQGQIRTAISMWRYVFFLALQSANFDIVLIPPLDVAAMHFAQLTVNPSGYRRDCLQISGRVVDCNYRLLLATEITNEDKMRLHKEVWDKMVESKMRATNRNLFWLKYDYDAPNLSSRSSSEALDGISPNPLAPPVEACGTSDEAVSRPSASEISLNLVLDEGIVQHFVSRTPAAFAETMKEFFRISTGFLRCEAHFEEQGVELWVRYARYLALYSVHRRAHCSASDASPQSPRVKVDRPDEAPLLNAELLPVPTLGMHLLLHLHRTTHLKYDRCLDLFNIDPFVGIIFNSSKDTIKATAKVWESVFNEPYLRDASNESETGGAQSPVSHQPKFDQSVDVEYNMSLKLGKKDPQSHMVPKTLGVSASVTGSMGGDSSLGSAGKSSLMSRSNGAKKVIAPKRVTIMTADVHESV